MITSEFNDLLYDAIVEYTKETSDSLLGDLLMLFDRDVVIKLLITFSGEAVHFPKLDSIWKKYAASTIYSVLSVKDTQTQREQLARYFGLSLTQVADIYRYQKKLRQLKSARQKRNKKDKDIKKTAERVYKNSSKELFSQLRKVKR